MNEVLLSDKLHSKAAISIEKINKILNINFEYKKRVQLGLKLAGLDKLGVYYILFPGEISSAPPGLKA